MQNLFKTLFSPKKRSQRRIPMILDDGIELSEYDMDKIQEKNFKFIAYCNEKMKNSSSLKKLVREMLGQRYGRVYVYDVTYQEKRQFDSVSYDYKYTHYKVYLNEKDKWVEEYQETTYSENLED